MEFSQRDNSDTIWLLRRAVYLTVFIYFLMLLPGLHYFFGAESIRFGYNQLPDWFGWMIRLLFEKGIQDYYMWFIGGLFISLAIGIISPLVRVMSVLVYFFAANLFNKVEYISNGSVTVTTLLLIYLVFMSENKKAFSDERWSYPNNLLTNVAFFMAQLQICILYLSAGMNKLIGNEWLAGEAFYYTLNFAFFTQPTIADQLMKSDLVLYLCNYLALGYQLLFWVLVWFKPVKKWLLIVGVALHFGIIVLNGLVDFGLIMLASYLLFIEPETARKLRSLFFFFNRKTSV
jgi:hypothetical protein